MPSGSQIVTKTIRGFQQRGQLSSVNAPPHGITTASIFLDSDTAADHEAIGRINVPSE